MSGNEAKQNTPSPNGENGVRDRTGRFVKGNPGGPGNPLSTQVYRLRQCFYASVSEGDLTEIVTMIVAKAKGGDIGAAKLVLEWTIGRPGTLAQFTAGEPLSDALKGILD